MEQIVNNIENVFNNQTFVTVLSIILAFYAGAIAPALPNNVIYFFDSIIGKVLFIFLIGYMASRNVQIALMLSVAFVVTLTISNKNKIKESYETFTDNVENDGEEEFNNESESDGEEEFNNENDNEEEFNNENDNEEEFNNESENDNEEEFDNYQNEHFDVNPANNLSGNSSVMYAPYN